MNWKGLDCCLPVCVLVKALPRKRHHSFPCMTVCAWWERQGHTCIAKGETCLSTLDQRWGQKLRTCLKVMCKGSRELILTRMQIGTHTPPRFFTDQASPGVHSSWDRWCLLPPPWMCWKSGRWVETWGRATLITHLWVHLTRWARLGGQRETLKGQVFKKLTAQIHNRWLHTTLLQR